MRNKLSGLLTLPRRDHILLAQAWTALLLANITIRFTPLGQVKSLLASFLRPAPEASAGPSPLHVARLVDIAARHHVLPMHCLQRALALQSLLSRTGHDAELRIGIRCQHGSLHAHAWVETGGIPLAENPAIGSLFTPLLRASQEPL